MIRIKTLQEIVDSVYGDQFKMFTRSTQEAIFKMLRYFESEGVISTDVGSMKDVDIALDDALRQHCSETIEHVLKAPRLRKYVDLRTIIYKIISDKTGMIPRDMYNFLGQIKDRTTIYHHLRRFDDLYKYDPNFRDEYDEILRLTNKNMMPCEKEQSGSTPAHSAE